MGFLLWEARFIHELLRYASVACGFFSIASGAPWHRFYSVTNPLMRQLPIGAHVILGAPRHCQFGHLLNRLNQNKLECPIPAITGCALLDKAWGFVMKASVCCWTPCWVKLTVITSPDTMLQPSATVASAHKSALQSFHSFLCLTMRVRHES
ncbi:hypothetical protein [Paraburkholderia flagellata]|uniref:hypothetical protein n=1 Tax=Paraburkholderia flagellata TaxID=2883241 RepID=UPI001F15FA87|nr:hypothetical protein [Paraburkholderia flagellata]